MQPVSVCLSWLRSWCDMAAVWQGFLLPWLVAMSTTADGESLLNRNQGEPGVSFLWNGIPILPLWLGNTTMGQNHSHNKNMKLLKSYCTNSSPEGIRDCHSPAIISGVYDQWLYQIWIGFTKSMAYCKNAVTPVHLLWSDQYCAMPLKYYIES